MDLPGHGEAAPVVEFLGGLISLRRRTVEEPYVVLAVVYSLPQNVDDATALNLPFETVQKPLAGVGVGVQAEGWAVSGWVSRRKAARWARSTQDAGR